MKKIFTFLGAVFLATASHTSAADITLSIEGRVDAYDRQDYGGATISMGWEVTAVPEVENPEEIKLYYQIVKDGASATEDWKEAVYNYGRYMADESNLEYSTKYTVMAYAQYETVRSVDWTSVIITPTPMPTIKFDSYNSEVTANSAIVTFNYTTTNWVEGYSVKIAAMNNETYMYTYGTGDSTTGTMEFNDLDAGTTYNYTVMLYILNADGNEIGWGFSDPMSFTTEESSVSLRLRESGITYKINPNASVNFSVSENAITSTGLSEDAIIDIYYQLNGDASYSMAVNNQGSYTFEILGLNYQTTYQVNIYAATGEGASLVKSNTVSVTFVTPPATPTVNILSAKASDVTSTSATVTAEVISENVPDGGKVCVYLKDTDNNINMTQNVAEGQQAAVFNLIGLSEETSYYLTVYAEILNSHDDPMAQSMEMNVEVDTSGITLIEATNLEGARLFDLNGHEIKTKPVPGVYIRVEGNEATKVLVK